MFRGSYQKKLLTILYSGGSNPLEIWAIQVKNGWTRRVKDEDMGCIVFEICGTNVATAYIVSPPDPKGVLGISLPFITMFIKNLKRYFTFEIQILDDKQMRRRFRFSNYQSSTKVRPFTCSVPLALKPGWNQMQLNLANFTTRAYGTNYVETQRVQIHANCRIRRVYFSDRLYGEEELPRDYRIYLNVRQAPQPPSETPKDVSVQKIGSDSLTQPTSILKISQSLQGTVSELMGKTSLKTESSSMIGSKFGPSRSVQLITPIEELAEKTSERKTTIQSITSRRSQKTLSKGEEERGMTAIVEEKEPQTPEVEGEEGEIRGAEDAVGEVFGEAVAESAGEAIGEAAGEEHEGEGVMEGLQESPAESPRQEEDAPITESPRTEDTESPRMEETESPRTDETESPRSEVLESEVAESEPIPESDAEVPESDVEEIPAEPPSSPEEPPTE